MLDAAELGELAGQVMRALEPGGPLGAGLLALLGGAGGALAVLAALGRGRPRRPATDPGVVLTLENGRLQAGGRAARRFLGGGARSAGSLAGRLSRLEGPQDLPEALRELETRGRAFRMLVEDAAGAVWDLDGAPEGGRARLRAAPAGPDRKEVARLRLELDAAGAARDRLAEALDAAPLAVCRRDASGRVVWANRRHRQLSDGASGELRLDAAGPARPRRDGRRAVFDAGGAERRWVTLSERPAADGGALGYAQDAGAEVHAEAALRRFVETLTETFAHLRVGLAVFDREQRLGLFNPAFAEMMRLDPAWLAGRPGLPEVLERLRAARRIPDMEDFRGWRRDLSALFGEAGGGPRPERTETWHLPGEERIRMMARPHPQGAVAFLFEDVSEAAALERRALTETEMRRAVMDRLEEGVAAFGPDGAARFANPAFAAIWGFRPGTDPEAPGLAEALPRLRAAALPEAAGVWARLTAFFEHSGPRLPWAEELALRDGRRLRARVAALPDGSVLAAFTDITDATRAAEAGRELSTALEAAEELRGALVEQVSARLRTPLNTLFGYGQMLMDASGADAPSERQAAWADGILDAAAEIQEALNGVADLAAAQSGALALTRAPVDLRAALASAMELARRSARGRGVALTLADASGAEAVAGDAARLRQLLFNLIVDAVHRAPPGGEVRAGAARAGEGVEIWTEEPAAPRAPADEGPPPLRGLAHALVRRFAELHGGSVEVELAAARGTPLGEGAGEAEAERPLPFGEDGPAAPCLRVRCTLPAAALQSSGAAPASAVA
jgi:signal transduction histidine kinase